LVGHSLGGLLALDLKRRMPERLGRVVQIAPPNAGSVMADLKLIKWTLGPAIHDIRSAQPPELSDTVTADLGIIAGSASPLPCARAAGCTGVNDGIVSLDSAFALTAADLLTVRRSHFGLSVDRDVAAQCLAFLKTGNFLRSLDSLEVAEMLDAVLASPPKRIRH
jgi:pimeloyl-ACP methyl ester carboxylesterase